MDPSFDLFHHLIRYVSPPLEVTLTSLEFRIGIGRFAMTNFPDASMRYSFLFLLVLYVTLILPPTREVVPVLICSMSASLFVGVQAEFFFLS